MPFRGPITLSPIRSSAPSRRPAPTRRGHVLFGLTVAGVVLGALLAAPALQAGPASVAKQVRAAQFPGGPYFVLACGFSHRNNDDPIVFPGQPGRSHNHTYVGNRRVDAATTPDSLLDGPTTCESDADASAYWVPTLYVGTEPVHPLAGIVYYTKRTHDRPTAPPPGLRMVAGNADAERRQPKGTVAWSCGVVGGRPRYYVVPRCHEDQLTQLQVNFPNCWDGRSLDSADHKRHVAYAAAGRCRASHPVVLPTITIILLYPPVPAGAQVSSGKLAAHADFINGWEQSELETFVSRMR
jgi:hypothetical protein